MGRLRVVLEDVRISSPCSVAWEQMSGDDRVRHCAKCELDVFNLSSMSRAEAEALLASRLGSGVRLCGGGIRRADGSFLSGDCPSGDAAHRAHFAAEASLAASMVLAVFLLALGVFWQMRRMAGADHADLVHYGEDVFARSPTLSGLERVARGQSFTPPRRAVYGMISYTPSTGTGAAGGSDPIEAGEY